MRNLSDEEDDYNYGPNELAELSRSNPDKYRKIVESNLQDGDSIERWQQRNLERAKEDLAWQQRNKQ